MSLSSCDTLTLDSFTATERRKILQYDRTLELADHIRQVEDFPIFYIDSLEVFSETEFDDDATDDDDLPPGDCIERYAWHVHEVTTNASPNAVTAAPLSLARLKFSV